MFQKNFEYFSDNTDPVSEFFNQIRDFEEEMSRHSKRKIELNRSIHEWKESQVSFKRSHSFKKLNFEKINLKN